MLPVLLLHLRNRNEQRLAIISLTSSPRRWWGSRGEVLFLAPASVWNSPHACGLVLLGSRQFPQHLPWHLAPFTQSNHCCRKWGSCDHLAPSPAWHLRGRRNFLSPWQWILITNQPLSEKQLPTEWLSPTGKNWVVEQKRFPAGSLLMSLRNH